MWNAITFVGNKLIPVLHMYISDTFLHMYIFMLETVPVL